MLLVPRGWDIGPTIPMDPSAWPSWNARSHGHLHEGRPLYIHTYILPCDAKISLYTAVFVFLLWLVVVVVAVVVVVYMALIKDVCLLSVVNTLT